MSASQGLVRSTPLRGDTANAAANTRAAEPPAAAVTALEAPASTPASSEEVSSTKLEELSQRLNEFVQNNARELEFRVNDEGGRVVILVRQATTGEVLRTIPPEEATDLVNNLTEGAAALFSQLA